MSTLPRARTRLTPHSLNAAQAATEDTAVVNATFVLRHDSSKVADLEQLLQEQTTPGHPQLGRHLSREQVRPRPHSNHVTPAHIRFHIASTPVCTLLPFSAPSLSHSLLLLLLPPNPLPNRATAALPSQPEALSWEKVVSG